MRNCFQITICKSWFSLDKSKTLVTSQVPTYRGKAGLILKTPLRSLHTKRDFPNGTLHTCFLWCLTQSWTCRIDWTITYPSLEVFSQEFYFHLSNYLNDISVPFTKKRDKAFNVGIFPVPTFRGADRISRASLDSD